jgi:hypothetical protein
MNTTQHTLMMGAIKSGVSAVTGVILANMVDTPQTLFSWLWVRHLLIVIIFVLVATEARFWNQWANSGATPPPLQQSLADAAASTVKVGDAIAKAQTEAPKAVETPTK